MKRHSLKHFLFYTRLETVPARHTWMPGDDESRKQWVIYAGDKPKEMYDKMVEEMATALCNNTIKGHEAWSRQHETCKAEYRRDARAALAAIGIAEPKS